MAFAIIVRFLTTNWPTASLPVLASIPDCTEIGTLAHPVPRRTDTPNVKWDDLEKVVSP